MKLVPIGGELRTFYYLMRDWSRETAYEDALRAMANREELRELKAHLDLIETPVEVIKDSIMDSIAWELRYINLGKELANAIRHAIEDNSNLQRFYFTRTCPQHQDTIGKQHACLYITIIPWARQGNFLG